MRSVVFGHNDEWLASVSADGTVRVWDFTTGEQLQKFRGLDESGFLRISFLANDTGLVTTSSSPRDNIKTYTLSPTLPMSAFERWNYVCGTRLLGMQAFRSDEMEDIILRGRRHLQNPCRRRGPLSLTYYLQAADDSWQWIRSVIKL